MKFDAAAITPGRAKSCQKGTDPSAKSIQSGVWPGRPHCVGSTLLRVGDAAGPGRAAAPAHTATTRRIGRSFLTAELRVADVRRGDRFASTHAWGPADRAPRASNGARYWSLSR